MVAGPDRATVAPGDILAWDEPKLSSEKSRQDSQKVVEYAPPSFWQDSTMNQRLQKVLTDMFVFVAVHYTFWFLPFAGVAYILMKAGKAWIVATAMILYIPTLIVPAQCSAQGWLWEWFRGLTIWNLVASDYLGMKMIREAPLDAPNKRYVFGYHPHGILVLSRFGLAAGNWAKLFPGIDFRYLGASAIFRVPLCREVCLWLGAVDASRATAEKVLASGRSIAVYPGGVPAIFTVKPESKETTLIINKRLGFIKLAIQHGADLVPVFVFGEKWLYNVWTPPPSVVAFVRKTLNVPLIFFWGRFLWMPLTPPKGKTFGVVYGKPITVTRCEDPSEEQVRELHTVYVRELERLFAMHKGSFGYDDDEKLVIT